MKEKALFLDKTRRVSARMILVVIFTSLAATACGPTTPEVPAPRPIVIRSGDRLFAEPERMEAIDAWYRLQWENIETDPSFMIAAVSRDTPSYPWESIVLGPDTATIAVQTGYDEAVRVFQLYAHYRLMADRGRVGEFLPGGEDLEGFALERAILARVSDAWFLARAAYQAVAFDPLEELLYANENGYLDALILTARGDEFKEEKAAWLEEDPGALERYRSWFLETFSKEPPGIKGTS
jgi:hypothetical protein